MILFFLCRYSSAMAAEWTLLTSIFILTTIAVTASAHHLATHVHVYQKLEHVLITDSKVRYLIQDTFFPPQRSPRDIVYIRVNIVIDSMLPRSCSEHPPSSGMLINHSYYYEFQWSSSPLLNLISVDQVLILDNVLSESIYHVVQHHGYLHVSLHIDDLPCNTSEDDLLAALMELLPWVRIFVCARVWHSMYGNRWHMQGVRKASEAKY